MANTSRNYNYDTRTLATWYLNKILEGKGSYYKIYKAIETCETTREKIVSLMKYVDRVFCDQSRKIDLLQKSIVFILQRNSGNSMSRSEIIQEIIASIEVSPEILEASTKSGNESTLEKEIEWEIQHLVNAGIIKRVSRGYYTVA